MLDLSGPLAGEADAMIRFRYDTNGAAEGNLWQLDDIELEIFEAAGVPENLPGPASAPSPADGAGSAGLDSDLSWAAGTQTESHDVYFGTAAPLGPGDFRGNQAGASFDLGPLAAATSYYWRVDEVNAEGTVRGCTWSFTTAAEAVELLLSDGFEDSD